MEVTSLRASRETGRVAYLRLMQCYMRYPEKLFCFFEGEDAKYYGLSIEQIFGSFMSLPCGGKKEVLKALDLVRTAGCFSETKTAFFVDRDFDDSLGGTDPDLFETTCYSIENYYISDSAFQRLLRAEFDLEVDAPEYATVQSLFVSTKRDFMGKVQLLNAWIYHQRRVAGRDGHNLHLTRINLRKYLKISLGTVEGTIGIGHIREIFPEFEQPSQAELEAALAALAATIPEVSYRGKLNIEFYFAFLMLLKDAASRGLSDVFGRPRKVKLNCSKQNIISELSGYADRPDELIRFVSKYRNRK